MRGAGTHDFSGLAKLTRERSPFANAHLRGLPIHHKRTVTTRTST